MKFVITGASGHIGNNLVRMINREYPQDKVVVLTRRIIEEELENTICEQRVGDLFSKSFLVESFDSESVVIHAAGYIDLTDKKREVTFRINTHLTRMILEACLERRVKKFVYIGSTDAICRENKDEIGEPHNYYPERIEGNYGKSKAEASKLVLEAIRNNPDFSAGIIIPSAVVGINDFKPSAVGKIIDGVIRGKPEIGIRGGYNFVDVEDVCRAIISLCKSDERGQFIVSGEAVEVPEMFERINSKLGIKRRIIILPTGLVKFFLPFVKSLNKITLKALGESHSFSNKRACEILKITPTPFDKTLDKTLEWFKLRGENG